ncbi:MAG: GyrI-like domain-containing protein [Ignavibacteria bacterium]
MDHKIITLDEIKVIGIEARTSNDSASDEIPKLWQKFFTEKIKENILNKISSDILSLYTEYESDYTKPYTIVLCCKVKDFSEVPDGMVSKIIPASKFAVFNAKGKMPDELVKTWENIWSSDLDRTYTGDFDLYTEKYFSDQPEADVYVAIK